MRAAVIEKSTGKVVNVIVADPIKNKLDDPEHFLAEIPDNRPEVGVGWTYTKDYIFVESIEMVREEQAQFRSWLDEKWEEK